MQIISSENTDIAFIQEPYVYQNRIKGITGNYRIYGYGEDRSRAAIIPNDTIDTLMITQCSDDDIVLLEIKVGQATFCTASAYMDFNDAIVNYFKKIERILEFTKGAKIILAIDSNSRSTTWYDVTTNERGRLLEEFVASNQLHIINEESLRTTFHSIRGQSNIDIAITNRMLAAIENWEISEEESASDHKIIKFNLKIEEDEENIIKTPELRYIIKEH